MNLLRSTCIDTNGTIQTSPECCIRTSRSIPSLTVKYPLSTFSKFSMIAGVEVWSAVVCAQSLRILFAAGSSSIVVLTYSKISTLSFCTLSLSFFACSRSFSKPSIFAYNLFCSPSMSLSRVAFVFARSASAFARAACAFTRSACAFSRSFCSRRRSAWAFSLSCFRVSSSARQVVI